MSDGKGLRLRDGRSVKVIEAVLNGRRKPHMNIQKVINTILTATLFAVLSIGDLGFSYSDSDYRKRAIALFKESKYEALIPILLQAYESAPNKLWIERTLAISYERLKQFDEALKWRQALQKRDGNDWLNLAKLIQLYSRAGNLEKRDQEIETLYRLRKELKDPDFQRKDHFPREYIDVGDHIVSVKEFFDPKGDQLVFFEFVVVDKNQDLLFWVSVGSYEKTTRAGRAMGEIPEDGRIYHCDLYWPGGSHQTLAFFREKQPYDEYRNIALTKIKELLARHSPK